jgi:hypothetical protein
VAASLQPSLLHQPIQIKRLLCDIALSHRVDDPTRFIADVLDHLPTDAQELRRYEAGIYNRLHMQLAMQSYNLGHTTSAQGHILKALDYGAGSATPSVAFGELLAYTAMHLPVQDPIRYIRSVLRNLPAQARFLGRGRRLAISQTHLRIAREASFGDAPWLVLYHNLQAIGYKPRSVRAWKLLIAYLRQRIGR